MCTSVFILNPVNVLTIQNNVLKDKAYILLQKGTLYNYIIKICKAALTVEEKLKEVRVILKC